MLRELVTQHMLINISKEHLHKKVTVSEMIRMIR